jgi:zinc transporter ZupT
MGPRLFASALLLSVLALASGLALVVAGQDRPRLRLAVDGFILGIVPTLVAARVLPHLWVELRAASVAFVAMGYGIFWLIESVAEHQRLRARVVVTVLALHSLLDGASLAVAQRLQLGRASAVLMTALVIHRLPEGLVVGALLVPRHGIKVAVAGATLLAVMTVAGAVGGVELLQQASGWWLSLAVAGGMGALLRAVLHRHTSSPLRAGPGALSALLGAALALAVPELP